MIFGLSKQQLRGMRVYGLTGGIGCGKSEVSKTLHDMGFPIIDADKIGHQVIAHGGPAVNDVFKIFGEPILTCGNIDREKLGAIVFADKDALAQLNSVVHPAIGLEMAKQCLAYAEDGRKAVVVDAPLLVETGAAVPGLSGLIVVTCHKSVQQQRLTEIRGMTEQQVEQRIRSQAPQEEKIRAATWVIENNGTLEELRNKVSTLAKELETSGR